MDNLKGNDLDNLNEPYDHIARIIGMDNTKKLAKVFGGEYVYFPSTLTYQKSIRNELIQADNTSDYKQLAKKYGLTVRHVRRIKTGK